MPLENQRGKIWMEVCDGGGGWVGQVLPVAGNAIKNVYMCNLRRDMDYRGGKVPIIVMPSSWYTQKKKKTRSRLTDTNAQGLLQLQVQ